MLPSPPPTNLMHCTVAPYTFLDEAEADPRPPAQHHRVLRQADLQGGGEAAAPGRHLHLPRGAAELPRRVRLVQGQGRRRGRAGRLRLLQRGQLPAGHALLQVPTYTQGVPSGLRSDFEFGFPLYAHFGLGRWKLVRIGSNRLGWATWRTSKIFKVFKIQFTD